MLTPGANRSVCRKLVGKAPLDIRTFGFVRLSAFEVAEDIVSFVQARYAEQLGHTTPLPQRKADLRGKQPRLDLDSIVFMSFYWREVVELSTGLGLFDEVGANVLAVGRIYLAEGGNKGLAEECGKEDLFMLFG